MARSRDPHDTIPPDDESDERPRRRTPIEVPADRPATLAELAGVSTDLRELEVRVSRVEHEARTTAEVRAEWLGRDGRGGRMGALEAEMKRASTSVHALETWRIGVTARASVWLAVGGAAAGLLAAVAIKLVDYLTR